jgi:hypothetical protein
MCDHFIPPSHEGAKEATEQTKRRKKRKCHGAEGKEAGDLEGEGQIYLREQIRGRSQKKLKVGHKNHTRSRFSQNQLETVGSASANESHKMKDRTAIFFLDDVAPASFPGIC